MDSSNVWYYAVEGDRLLVYDAGTDELDELGALQDGLTAVIQDWHATVQGVLDE